MQLLQATMQRLVTVAPQRGSLQTAQTIPTPISRAPAVFPNPFSYFVLIE